MTVLAFEPSSRRTPLPTEPLECPCGSQWFELRGATDQSMAPRGAVTLTHDGQVTGFSGVPHCLECGLSSCNV
jgi:hypothetical protein